jgi:squalene-hopene/tetraprenyl-beta-curcumene cyclase
MTLLPSRNRSLIALIVVALGCSGAGEERKLAAWKPDAAGRYLDERAKFWFGSAKCISCHTALPYALGRPALRKLTGVDLPSEQETKLLAQIRLRVANWTRLDTKDFGLYYDANDELKKQSWGTEAVFNAVILALDDCYQSKSSPSEATKQAFVNLWQTQVQTGENKGTWDWLDFNEAPWGNAEARYFGATLASIAVGTAPGYYSPGADPESDARVKLLVGNPGFRTRTYTRPGPSGQQRNSKASSQKPSRKS